MVTHTWIKSSDTKTFISELTLPGFVLYHSPRSQQTKGEIKKVLDKNVSSKIIKSPTYQSFENISVSTDLGDLRLNLVTFY